MGAVYLFFGRWNHKGFTSISLMKIDFLSLDFKQSQKVQQQQQQSIVSWAIGDGGATNNSNNNTSDFWAFCGGIEWKKYTPCLGSVERMFQMYVCVETRTITMEGQHGRRRQEQRIAGLCCLSYTKYRLSYLRGVPPPPPWLTHSLTSRSGFQLSMLFAS